ncbi:MAG: methyltransferase [Limisphaerales bacterium]
MGLFRQLFGRREPLSKPAEAGPSLNSLLGGYRNTALLYVAARLKIPDLLAAGPRSSRELSEILNANAPALHRVLRGLVALGLCSEMEDGYFQLLPLGEKLQSSTGGPEYSLAILNGEEYAAAWNDLLHSVMTGEASFDHVFGESPWQHRQKNPELNERFNFWLEEGAAAAGLAISKAYDFSQQQTVADLGGGQGTLLAAILQANASLQGVLFDQPHVISIARRKLESAGLKPRCQLVEGSFFEPVPVEADVCILKSILHDWDDEKCLLILKNCRAVLKPGQPLLVVEKIMSERVKDQPSIIMADLQMLVVTGGRERTLDEYKKVFAAAGFELKRTIPLSTGHCLLETHRSE